MWGGCLVPVPLLGLLLQAGQQSVQTVVVAVQQPRRQLAEVSVVLLVEERKGQVTPRPDVVQNKSKHVFFHHPLKLRHEPRKQLHSDLPHRVSTVTFYQEFPSCFNLWRNQARGHNLHGTCHSEQSPSLSAGCVWLLWKLTFRSGCLRRAGRRLTVETLFSFRSLLPSWNRLTARRLRLTAADSRVWGGAWTHLVCAVGRMGSGSLLAAGAASWAFSV